MQIEKTTLSIAEFAARHGISKRTVLRELKRKRLPHRKLDRRTLITQDDERQWLEACRAA